MAPAVFFVSNLGVAPKGGDACRMEDILMTMSSPRQGGTKEQRGGAVGSCGAAGDGDTGRGCRKVALAQVWRKGSAAQESSLTERIVVKLAQHEDANAGVLGQRL